MVTRHAVPEQYRPWSVEYPGYRPFDIGLRWGASGEPDSPTEVDWPARQTAALVPLARDAVVAVADLTNVCPA